MKNYLPYLAVIAAILIAWRLLGASPVPAYFDTARFTKDSQGNAAPAELLPAAADTVKNLNIIQYEAFKKWGPAAKIDISSGYRSTAYNTQIGGATNSYHTKAQAVDFKVSGVPPADVHRFVYALMQSGKIKKGGIGQATTYTHYDTRGTAKTWRYANGSTGQSYSVDINTLA